MRFCVIIDDMKSGMKKRNGHISKGDKVRIGKKGTFPSLKGFNNGGGRKSKSDAELWERREKVYRLYSTGITKSEIARQFGVTPACVGDDLDAVGRLEPVKDIKRKIEGHFNEAIRFAFERLQLKDVSETSKVGYLHEVNESVTRLARIHGLDKGDVYNNNYETNILVGVKIYEKWNDDKLKDEFNRRKLKMAETKEIPQ